MTGWKPIPRSSTDCETIGSVKPRGKREVRQLTSKIASISTAILLGSDPMPTALRAPTP